MEGRPAAVPVRAPARAPRAARRGLTLVELLLVMTILALVLGFGVGMLTSIDLGDRVARSQVQNALRAANNWAVASGAPARVRLAAPSALEVQGLRVVGTWHFEELPPEGAFGLGGAQLGGRAVLDGFQGRALTFTGEPRGAVVSFGVHELPSFTLTEGFALELALRHERPQSGRALRFGDVLALEVLADGTLRGYFFAAAADETGAPVRGPKVQVETDPGALPLDRWARVALSYDRRRLRLAVDGVTRATLPETAAVWPPEGPLVLSDEASPFQGSVDSLVVSAVSAEERVELPEGVTLAPGGPPEVVFAPGGGLDRDAHPGAVEVALVFEDGRRAAVVVGPYGTVE